MSKDYSEIAYKHTRFFVEECGERIAGTTPMNKAAEHAVEVFRSLGMKYIQHHFQVPVCRTEKSVRELRTGNKARQRQPGCSGGRGAA